LVSASGAGSTGAYHGQNLRLHLAEIFKMPAVRSARILATISEMVQTWLRTIISTGPRLS
jgi:hypothetical protein